MSRKLPIPVIVMIALVHTLEQLEESIETIKKEVCNDDPRLIEYRTKRDSIIDSICRRIRDNNS